MDRHISKPPPSIIILALFCLSSRALAGCDHPVAKLVAFQGSVQRQSDESGWQEAKLEHALCRGDKFRTLLHTRATLELENRTYITLEQQTTIVFSNLKPQEPSWLDLLKGVLYLRSRTPSSLDIRTPFVNAAIKGTEFLVSSSDTEGQVTVFEGRIEASNPQGSLILTDGQTAVAESGAAPARKLSIKPEDAVQWALYYPPLLDLESLKRSADPAVKAAAGLYLAGDVAGALKRLEGSSQTVVRAGLLLGIGRVDEARALLNHAPTQISPRERADLQALRAVIALAQNQREQALAQAEQSTATDPSSPLGWIALSYVRQAGFKLEAALTSARKAAELAPDNGLIQARIAELSAALGERHEARHAADRAVQLNPNLARAWVVKGFAQLNAMDAGAAQSSFQQALRLDANDPLSRFGLGLAKIRQGELERGTADLEIAASLDPNDSLIRSYLGKAYYEQKRGKLAETEYGLAKQFDPKDPTPWFYDAIKKQTENRPVEALQDMQQAIDLNDNRAVYRSKQMLDSDLAARSAAQGRIYNDLGFGTRALVEGWKSVSVDPADYSAHRLLADNYASLPNNELARTSELLQSQLFQPINLTPLQPHLAERNLVLVPGSGPPMMGYNEFNPLFTRNGFNLQTSGIVGSLDTYGDEVVHSGIWDKFSYSLGQFHHESNGFRPNNRISQDIYNAFFQGKVNEDLSLQAEFRHKNLEYGDLNYNFDLNAFDPNTHRERRSDSGRLGARYDLSRTSQLIASAIYLDELNQNTDSSYLESFGLPPTITLLQRSHGYLLEGQHLFRSEWLDVISGGGFHRQWYLTETPQAFIDANKAGMFPFVFPERADVRHGNAYSYALLHLPKAITWTLGGSVDIFDDGTSSQTFTQFNPKAGVLWNLTPATTLRAAIFRTLKRTLLTDQTIEPTQVAGFNQLFDDPAGTRAWRYGLGFDHRFSKTIFGGFEASRRTLDYLFVDLLSGANRDYSFYQADETLYRAYANWAPTAQTSISLSYQLEIFDAAEQSLTPAASFFIPGASSRTHSVPLKLSYFHPSGWLGNISTTYVDQTITDKPGAALKNDEFFLVDAGVGYRIPNRHGLLRFEVKNLFDQKFSYLGPGYRTAHEEKPQFFPERTFFANFTLSF